MNDERDRARYGPPPPTAPYLPVQTGGVRVIVRHPVAPPFTPREGRVLFLVD